MTEYVEFQTRGNADMIDITTEVKDAVQKSGLDAGVVVVFAPGATGALTTIEYEPGLVEDMKWALERVAPEDRDYAHNLR